MKRLYLYLISIGIFYSSLFSQIKNYSGASIKPDKRHSNETYVIASLLNRFHPDKKLSSDSISKRLFDNYFNILDPNKLYFLEGDIASFEKLRFDLSNQILDGETDFAYEVYELFRIRVLNQITYSISLIERQPDFTVQETYTLFSKKNTWASTQEENNDHWRKIIKHMAIQVIIEGGNWDDFSRITIEKLREMEIAINNQDSDYVFHKYMNAYASAFDPSTQYFSQITERQSEVNLNPFYDKSDYSNLLSHELDKSFNICADTYIIRLEKEEYTLGVVHIPVFYRNLEKYRIGNEDLESSIYSIKKAINELKVKGIQGLMLDLRFNGGGPLIEAIDLTGLFIPDGPIVQVKQAENNLEKMIDEDNGKVFYDGPLVILVNRGSAAASEIFCAAIQDYKRGVIIGDKTFGKGTIQNVVSLKNYIRSSEPDHGYLKMTFAKLYRVNGGSFQRIGIAPDVQFPSIYSQEDFGEASRPNALPWDEVANASFTPTNNVSEELLDKLNAMYREDLNTDQDLQKLVKDIEEAKKNREQKSVSLNLETRRAKQNKTDELETAVETGDGLEVNEIDEKLKKDPYLKEGLKLLAAIAKYKIG